MATVEESSLDDFGTGPIAFSRLKALRALGADRLQGCVFGHPQPTL